MIKIITEPKVKIIGRPQIDFSAIDEWLEENDTEWHDVTGSGAEQLIEFAGRTCYQSFGEHQGTKGTDKYIANLIKQEHTSVLEHAQYSFLIEGVSRSLTHELVSNLMV